MKKRKMNTIFSVLAMMVLALFIAACDESQQGGVGTFIGGIESVSADFEKSIPAEVYDNKAFPFPMSVKVENKGEFDVEKEKVKVTLDGIDPAEFGKTPAGMSKNPSEDLTAAKLDATTGKIIPGTQTFVEFGDFNYQLNIQGTQEKVIRAAICYDYGTAAQAKLCIKERPLELEKSSVCEVKGIKQLAVSSGPVQVTSFEQTPSASDKIRFSFVIEHKGDGSIYKETKECNGRENENKVFIAVDTGDMSSSLTCSGIEGGTTSGYITLYDGKKTVSCTQSVAGKKGTFEKIATIKLGYGYEKIKQTKIIVKSND